MLPIPRLLWSDAYSISSYQFEAKEALDFSKYYLTFRKPFDPDDHRIVVAGATTLLKKLLATPITMDEVDETARFLKNRKVTTRGLRDFWFPEEMWRDVVNKFGGWPPITIETLLEGSVAYPNEPVLRVYSNEKGFGPLAAWWEDVIINYVWSASTRLTAARHWLKHNRLLAKSLYPKADTDQINLLASLAMHDFGARSAMTLEESEHVAAQHLYCFPGTDTFAAAYVAWKNGAPDGVGVSVDALAHRVVQGYVEEGDCYNRIYDQAEPGDIISMVADCYDYKHAVERYLLPLAEKSAASGNGKIVVARPDSGDALEQVLWTCQLAQKAGLYTVDFETGLKSMTTLRLIVGDSMTFDAMRQINEALIRAGWNPMGVLIFGVGGFLRNSITRDTLSTKYALCAVGTDQRPVVKRSEVVGKGTLPDCKVLRTPEALASGITLVATNENGYDDLHVIYQNGPLSYNPSFGMIQDEVLNGFDKMPVFGGQCSPKLIAIRDSVLENYR